MSRAVIVGAGVSGFLHALALRSAGVAIAGVFDPDGERARLLTSLVGGAALASLGEACAMEAEIAAICSPPPHHVTQAEALARPDRLVFVEKPVATGHGELARLRRLPHIVPILQWRAGRAARELHAAVRAGAFGPRPHVYGQLHLWRDDAYFATRGHARWGCGAMTSIGIHAIDLVLWILGRPVTGHRGQEWVGRAGVDVATQGELEIAFEGGATARILLSVDARGMNAVCLRVHGDVASAELRAGEADPTGTPLTLRGLAPIVDAGGALGSPLLVPYIHEALAAFRAKRPFVSVADTEASHVLAFALSPRREACSCSPRPPA